MATNPRRVDGLERDASSSLREKPWSGDAEAGNVLGGEPQEGRADEIRSVAERAKTLEGKMPRRATRSAPV
jgi:hypothetical protein